MNALTEAEAKREVKALPSSQGHCVEATLLNVEDAGPLAPGQAVRLE